MTKALHHDPDRAELTTSQLWARVIADIVEIDRRTATMAGTTRRAAALLDEALICWRQHTRETDPQSPYDHNG